MAKFPDEFRGTVERLVQQQLVEAQARGDVDAIQKLELTLDWIRHPNFGLCAVCGTVISLTRLVPNLTLRRCTVCEAEPTH